MHLLLPSTGGGPSSRERRRQVPFHPFSSPSPKEISACLLPYSGFPTTLSHLGESLPKDTRGPFQVQSGYRGRPGGRCGRELAGSPTSPPEPKLRGRCLGGGGGARGPQGLRGQSPPAQARPTRTFGLFSEEKIRGLRTATAFAVPTAAVLPNRGSEEAAGHLGATGPRGPRGAAQRPALGLKSLRIQKESEGKEDPAARRP